MNTFFYWIFAICIAIFFLRHIIEKYNGKEDTEYFLKDWMKVLGISFVFSNVFYSEKIMNFILKFIFLGSLDDSPFFTTELKMGQALLISLFTILFIGIIVAFVFWVQEIFKGGAFFGEGILSLILAPFMLAIYFVSIVFFMFFSYAIYFFFAVFFTGISSGELTGGEISKVFVWLAISFLASIFYNMIVDGYRKNRFGGEVLRKKYKEEKAKLKSQIGDKKRFLQTVKGKEGTVFEAGSAELDLLKERLRMLIRAPKDFLKEEN